MRRLRSRGLQSLCSCSRRIDSSFRAYCHLDLPSGWFWVYVICLPHKASFRVAILGTLPKLINGLLLHPLNSTEKVQQEDVSLGRTSRQAGWRALENHHTNGSFSLNERPRRLAGAACSLLTAHGLPCLYSLISSSRTGDCPTLIPLTGLGQKN